jgi:hypothetical protein
MRKFIFRDVLRHKIYATCGHPQNIHFLKTNIFYGATSILCAHFLGQTPQNYKIA